GARHESGSPSHPCLRTCWHRLKWRLGTRRFFPMAAVVSRRRMLQTAMAVSIAPASLAVAQDADTVADLAPTVSRVYPGTDGRLIYVADEQGNTIPDFSHAGYGGGGAAIPTVAIKETLWPVAGDNTASVQAAIDRVS